MRLAYALGIGAASPVVDTVVGLGMIVTIDIPGEAALLAGSLRGVVLFAGLEQAVLAGIVVLPDFVRVVACAC